MAEDEDETPEIRAVINFDDLANPSVRLFWFRRRLIALGAVCSAVTLALFAYIPLSDTAAVSQGVFWYEWLVIIVAAFGAVGSTLYALPWRFPGTEWSYAVLGWDATFAFILFQLSVPFTANARALISSTLVLIMVVAFSAHILDGGQRKNANSLLFGPPP